MHTAIIGLRAHFVYVLFVLFISVQYVGYNLAMNIYVVLLLLLLISLGQHANEHYNHLPAAFLNVSRYIVSMSGI